MRLQWSLNRASNFLTVPGPTPVKQVNDAGCSYLTGHFANELAACMHGTECVSQCLREDGRRCVLGGACSTRDRAGIRHGCIVWKRLTLRNESADFLPCFSSSATISCSHAIHSGLPGTMRGIESSTVADSQSSWVVLLWPAACSKCRLTRPAPFGQRSARQF